MSKNTRRIRQQQGSGSPVRPVLGVDRTCQAPAPTGSSRLRTGAGVGGILLGAWNAVAAAYVALIAVDLTVPTWAGFLLIWTVPACLATGIVLLTKHRSPRKHSPLLMLVTATTAFLCHAYLIQLQIPVGVIGGLLSAAVMTLAGFALTKIPPRPASLPAGYPTHSTLTAAVFSKEERLNI